MDVVHQLLAQEVPAATPLVEKRRVVEERLHEEQLLTEEVTEGAHRVEDVAQESQAPAHLPRGETRLERSTLLGKVAAHRAEERVPSLPVVVDVEALAARVGDLDEAQLGHAEWPDLHVDEQQRVAILMRHAELHAGPRLVRRRGDAQEPLALSI